MAEQSASVDITALKARIQELEASVQKVLGPAKPDKPTPEQKVASLLAAGHGPDGKFKVSWGAVSETVAASNELEARAIFNDGQKRWPPAKTVKVERVGK